MSHQRPCRTSAIKSSVRKVDRLNHVRDIPCPILISSLEAVARIRMIECPPSGIPGELPSTKTIRFTVCCDGSEEIEKVENDLRPSVGVDTNGNESRKCVGGKLGILRFISAHVPNQMPLETYLALQP